MRHQSVRDRMDEGEGMVRHEMRERMSSSSHSIYRNEVEKPELPHEGRMEHGWGCEEMKGEADPIAYGQAGGEGMKSDMKKMHAQFKNYHWADDAGASGY